eukprot:9503489-Pyramimonas_sp.AAC.2
MAREEGGDKANTNVEEDEDEDEGEGKRRGKGEVSADQSALFKVNAYGEGEMDAPKVCARLSVAEFTLSNAEFAL